MSRMFLKLSAVAVATSELKALSGVAARALRASSPTGYTEHHHPTRGKYYKDAHGNNYHITQNGTAAYISPEEWAQAEREEHQFLKEKEFQQQFLNQQQQQQQMQKMYQMQQVQQLPQQMYQVQPPLPKEPEPAHQPPLTLHDLNNTSRPASPNESVRSTSPSQLGGRVMTPLPMGTPTTSPTEVQAVNGGAFFNMREWNDELKAQAKRVEADEAEKKRLRKATAALQRAREEAEAAAADKRAREEEAERKRVADQIAAEIAALDKHIERVLVDEAVDMGTLENLNNRRPEFAKFKTPELTYDDEHYLAAQREAAIAAADAERRELEARRRAELLQTRQAEWEARQMAQRHHQAQHNNARHQNNAGPGPRRVRNYKNNGGAQSQNWRSSPSTGPTAAAFQPQPRY